MAILKALGAVLVLCAGLSSGVSLCREQSRKIGLLRELMSVLEQLQGELELRPTPLTELFLCTAACSRGEACAFLYSVAEDMQQLGEESFSAIWERQVLRNLSGLERSDRDELIRLGRVLGRMDLEAELRALASCRLALAGQLEALRKAAPARRRLILGLCTAAGLLTVIMMI